MKVDLFMEVHHKDDARHIAAARATLKFLLKGDPAAGAGATRITR